MQNSNGHKPAFHLKSIAGTSVGDIVEPHSAIEVVEAIAGAANSGSGAIPVGGGTHLGIGNAPYRAGVVISTRNLNRVLSYEPADMTLSVEAGTTLQTVQDVLAERGQCLPIEVSRPETSTIGGILAAALYGPKRLGWGTLRDYLIGIAVAYPDGTVGKAGGLVVKNVSGFDLMRMHHGALGTLGIVVSANFKVLPAPRSERTLIVTGVDDGDLPELRNRAMNWRGKLAAFQLDSRVGVISAAIRLDGRDRTTELLAAELANHLPGDTVVLDPDASRAFWLDYLAEQDSGNDPSRWWLRSRVKPSQSLELLARIGSQPIVSESVLAAAPGLGYVDLLGSGDLPAMRASLAELRRHAPRTTVVAMPESMRSDIDVWGDDVDAIDLMRVLKKEFDPDQTLNPGRFVGGL